MTYSTRHTCACLQSLKQKAWASASAVAFMCRPSLTISYKMQATSSKQIIECVPDLLAQDIEDLLVFLGSPFQQQVSEDHAW